VIPVRLPNGNVIQAELADTPRKKAVGLMFRASLPPDHGMLFVHSRPGRYPYWMFQVEIPLDIVWMDENQKIVEIVPNAQPCRSRCPNLGGHEPAQYVLEMPAGAAQANGLTIGRQVQF
jgi:uncharacterized membrane protein (UPF0127 family)